MAKKQTEIEKGVSEALKESSETKKQSPESPPASSEEKTEIKSEEEKQEEFKPKYSQFWDGDVDNYYQRLEKAYGESSQEGQRLAHELTEKEKEMEVVKKIVQSDEALKEKFTEKIYNTGYEGRYEDEELTPNTIARIVDEKTRAILREELPQVLKQNPVLASIETEKTAKEMGIVKRFEQEHPEINTNPQVANDLETAFGVLAKMSAQKGEMFDFEKTLNKAWRIINSGNEAELEEMKKESQREQASMSSVTSTQPATSSKKELTIYEKEIASKLGLTNEQYLEGKKLSEEAKNK